MSTQKSAIEQFTKEEISKRTHLEENAHQTANNSPLAFAINYLHARQMTPRILSFLKIKEKAQKEYLNFQIINKEWYLENLPKKLSGFKLLHLTDLHADIHPDFAKTLAEKLMFVEADACVITGDFQDKLSDPITKTIEAMKVILKNINCPIYATPGNHDKIELLNELSKMDKINMLINSTATITQSGEELILSGIDDPHFYKTHNIKKVAGEGCRILLSHSPETYKEAEHYRFSLCLSGHTHAGQIRIPPFGAIFKQAPIPKKMIWGEWRYKNLQGYTSSGTGACGVPLRLNCPPEIVIHTLKNKN